MELYVETNNATQSAIVAGVPPKGAAVWASRALKSSKIKEAVQIRNAELMAELDFTAPRIVRELAKIAGVNTADFITLEDRGDGVEVPIIDFSRTTRRHLAAVAPGLASVRDS